ncbi:hypothetical protein TNIN_92111 [Trichonephila inaurata madagascariensis]|uniref:Uncharacterized protein n=1 Tax=Trichonephila inaurata madagascariensis TaxID=2747483 RepID=A0A8X6YXY7_9ARAC|nr:hypothetical protein TNIN_92111 [Trichonephila inaurata madagascariensis]
MFMPFRLCPLTLTEDSLKCGRSPFEDDPHKRRPETTTTVKTHDIVLDDRQVKATEIVLWEYQKKKSVKHFAQRLMDAKILLQDGWRIH